MFTICYFLCHLHLINIYYYNIDIFLIFSRLMYYNLVGGALALSSRQMWTVNGYSNLYWGWGAEDDDMYTRSQPAHLLLCPFI